MPIGGTTYCQFGDVTGPPCAFVLPSGSQVRERYVQAMAFMDQQANSQAMRHRLGPRISVSSTDCSQGCSREAVLDVRPLGLGLGFKWGRVLISSPRRLRPPDGSVSHPR